MITDGGSGGRPEATLLMVVPNLTWKGWCGVPSSFLKISMAVILTNVRLVLTIIKLPIIMLSPVYNVLWNSSLARIRRF